MTNVECADCRFVMPQDWAVCPHCARPSRFPNVHMADEMEERNALDGRYQRAIQDATLQGSQAAIKRFEAAVLGSSAIITRSFEEVHRLATSDRQLYATYYQLTQTRIPEGSEWDVRRSNTDTALFGDRVKPEIRFAALSLDGEGLTNYGNCSIILKESMIAHCASVFHENSVLFMKKQNINIWDATHLPCGFRATWRDRHRICVAKIASRLRSTTQDADFPRFLLRPGALETDEFVEVHIFGSMTVRTFERVVVRQKNRQPKKSQLQALAARLHTANVPLEVRP